MKRLIGIALIAISLASAGCATRAAVVVGPPPARIEVIGVRPYRNAVWVPGYWLRARGGWVWVGGRWR